MAPATTTLSMIVMVLIALLVYRILLHTTTPKSHLSLSVAAFVVVNALRSLREMKTLSKRYLSLQSHTLSKTSMPVERSQEISTAVDITKLSANKLDAAISSGREGSKLVVNANVNSLKRERDDSVKHRKGEQGLDLKSRKGLWNSVD